MSFNFINTKRNKQRKKQKSKGANHSNKRQKCRSLAGELLLYFEYPCQKNDMKRVKCCKLSVCADIIFCRELLVALYWEHCFLLLSNDIFALARMSLRHRVEQVILQNLSLIAKEKVFCWALLSISGIATIK